MTDRQIMKELNRLSNRMNDIERKLDNYFLSMHNDNKTLITENQDGLVDVAEILSEHDDAITELAELIGNNVETEE